MVPDEKQCPMNWSLKQQYNCSDFSDGMCCIARQPGTCPNICGGYEGSSEHSHARIDGSRSADGIGHSRPCTIRLSYKKSGTAFSSAIYKLVRATLFLLLPSSPSTFSFAPFSDNSNPVKWIVLLVATVLQRNEERAPRV